MGIVDNNSSNVLAKNNTDIVHFQRGVKYVHKLKIEKDTKLYKILIKDEIQINSRHNYHLTSVNDLKISAYSEDGLIESVEAKNIRFVLGVQWHPESMLEYDEDSNKIFDAFISSCTFDNK